MLRNSGNDYLLPAQAEKKIATTTTVILQNFLWKSFVLVVKIIIWLTWANLPAKEYAFYSRIMYKGHKSVA